MKFFGVVLIKVLYLNGRLPTSLGHSTDTITTSISTSYKAPQASERALKLHFSLLGSKPLQAPP